MAHSGVFNEVLGHVCKAELNWTTADRLWATLQTNTAPTKTWNLYSDITNQYVGGTYVAGGQTFTPGTVTVAAAVCNLDGPDATWTVATFGPVYYSIVQHGTPATQAGNYLCSYHDLGGAQTVTAGTFTLQWSSAPAAVWNITSAPDA